MKNLVTLLFFSVFTTFTFAQGEFNIWHFGQNAGLDFNGGAPVALPGGQTSQQEGTASISDAAGNLLFYTDGMTVWNSNHLQMPNGFGLTGHNSSTQSALIVPQPGSNNIYYVFTTTITGAAARYSIVDMTLAGGLGDITTKNAILHNTSTEKLTSLCHSNGTDFWVVIHEAVSNVFLAYLLDNNGLNTTAVSSAVGSIHGGSGSSYVGNLKGSHDNQRLAVALRSPYLVEVFDFDNTTGSVSNPISIPSYYSLAYVEFSPDNSKIYTSFSVNNEIYQYDLNVGAADIANTEVLIANVTGGDHIGLQLAPDGKIYIAKYLENHLSAIDFPNLAGLACGFVDTAVSLGSGICRTALPNVISSLLPINATFQYSPACFSDTTFFTMTQTTPVDSVRWWFGDPASGASNTSTDMQPGHVFTASGNYLVELIVYYNGSIDTISNTIIIQNAPVVNLGNDTTICPGDTVLLEATSPGSTFQWQDGSTNASFNATNAGIYWVTAHDDCSSATDSLTIEIPPIVSVDIGNDTLICPGEVVVLDAFFSGATYQWQDGSDIALHTASSQGTYWVTATGPCNSVTDSINIEIPPPLSVELGNDTLVCEGEIVAINATTPGGDYLWQDGSNDSVYFAALPGTYIVEVSDDCQTGIDTLNVGHLPVPIVDLGPDTVLCGEHMLVLDAENPGSTYEWYNGFTNQTATVTTTGTYYVAVINADGCVGYDTIDVGFDMPPLVNLGPDTTIVAGTTLVLDAGPGFDYEWSTGETTQQIIVDSAGIYSVIITDDNGCVDADHIQVDIVSGISESMAGEISIYPSLVVDYVMVDFKSPTAGKADIEVFDLNGRLVFTNLIEISVQQFRIDFSPFPSGIYIIKVALENGVLAEKVVKIR